MVSMEDGMLLSSVSLNTEITFFKLKQWWHPHVHLARLVMPRLGSAQLSLAKHGLTKMGRAKPSHS